MSTSYVGRTGKIYELEDEYIAKGGEGTIYNIKGSDHMVAKLYIEKCRTPERENKLVVMVRHHLNDEQLSQITWPQDILYENNKIVGYVMPKLKNTKNLNSVYSQDMKILGLKERVTIAHNICVAVEEIHKIGQVCGDLNPQNICVNLDKTSSSPYHVTLVDTDSYHIKNEDVTYRCSVGLGTYIAPELQKKLTNGMNLETLPLPTFTRETDLFALAIHIFNLLMGGCHPFACAKKMGNKYENTMNVMDGDGAKSIVLPQPDENIKSGFFPFNQHKEGITYPLYAPAFESLPEEIRNLFIKTFEEGYTNPYSRVTAEEWRSVLRKYASDQLISECERGHKYFKHYGRCPYCEAEQRRKEMLVAINHVQIPTIAGKKSLKRGSSQSTATQSSDDDGTSSAILVTILLVLIFCVVVVIVSCSNSLEDVDANRDLTQQEIFRQRITSAEEYHKYEIAIEAYDNMSDGNNHKPIEKI